MMLTTPLDALGLYAGLNILLSLILSARVGMLRVRHRSPLGDVGNPLMIRAIRAHGNNIEYVPLGLVGLVILYILGAPLLVLHVGGAALTLGRVLHAIGLSKAEHSLGRQAGMMLTMASLVFIAGGCLYWATF